ncbi:MAG: single-stranded DNA-binding protein [Methanobrevibacter sp.]|nr:single-stranded DNA-binding protein [Methanobrevibacter sp.]
MNMINSIIIEGKIEKVEGNGLMPILIITIATSRFYKEGSETKEEVGHYEIEVFGRLAELKNFEIGREIRVVGRLRQNDKKVWILAEHIEFKPFIKKSEETENKEEVQF